MDDGSGRTPPNDTPAGKADADPGPMGAATPVAVMLRVQLPSPVEKGNFPVSNGALGRLYENGEIIVEIVVEAPRAEAERRGRPAAGTGTGSWRGGVR